LWVADRWSRIAHGARSSRRIAPGWPTLENQGWAIPLRGSRLPSLTFRRLAWFSGGFRGRHAVDSAEAGAGVPSGGGCVACYFVEGVVSGPWGTADAAEGVVGNAVKSWIEEADRSAKDGVDYGDQAGLWFEVPVLFVAMLLGLVLLRPNRVNAEPAQQYPIVDKIAAKVVAKYQNST